MLLCALEPGAESIWMLFVGLGVVGLGAAYFRWWLAPLTIVMSVFLFVIGPLMIYLDTEIADLVSRHFPWYFDASFAAFVLSLVLPLFGAGFDIQWLIKQNATNITQ